MDEDARHRSRREVRRLRAKFVVDRDGNVVARFEPTADMAKVEACIKSLR